MQTQLDLMDAALQSPVHWSHLILIHRAGFSAGGVFLKWRRSSTQGPGQSDLEWFDPFEPGRWKDARERITRWHFDSDLLQSLFASSRSRPTSGIGFGLAEPDSVSARNPAEGPGFFPMVRRLQSLQSRA